MQAKVTSPDGKTPSGSEAVRIAFSGKGGGCNVISPGFRPTAPGAAADTKP